jgi:hypothetical protein
LVVDAQGRNLVPSHSQKKSKRYRYYLSEPLTISGRDHTPDGIRIPAAELEDLVINNLRHWLNDANSLLEALNQPDPGTIQAILSRAQSISKSLTNDDNLYSTIQSLIKKVTVASNSIRIDLGLEPLLNNEPGQLEIHISDHPAVHLTIPVQIKRCNVGMRLIIPGPHGGQRQQLDTKLISVIAKGHDWLERLTSGKAKSIGEIALAEGVNTSRVTNIIYHAFLAPDIVRSILKGNQPASLTLDKLKYLVPLPIDWEDQRKLLGFSNP